MVQGIIYIRRTEYRGINFMNEGDPQEDLFQDEEIFKFTHRSMPCVRNSCNYTGRFSVVKTKLEENPAALKLPIKARKTKVSMPKGWILMTFSALVMYAFVRLIASVFIKVLCFCVGCWCYFCCMLPCVALNPTLCTLRRKEKVTPCFWFLLLYSFGEC